MTERGRDVLQAIALAGSRLGVMGLAALAALLVARWLGPAEFGIYASGAAVVPLMLSIGYAGIDQLYFRGDVARGELPGLLRSLAVLVLAGGIVLVLVLPGLEPGARLVAGILFVGMAAEITRAWWLLEPHKEGRLDRRGRRELLVRAVAAVVLVGAVIWVTSPIAAAIAQAVASIVLLTVLTARRRLGGGEQRTSMRVAPGRFREVLRSGLPFTVTLALQVVYLNLSGLLIAVLASTTEAGIYRVAFALFQMAMSVSIAVNNDAFRARLFAADVGQQGAVKRNFAALNGAAALMVAGGLALGVWLVLPIILGPEYELSVAPGFLLAAVVPLTFAGGYVMTILIATGRARAVARVQTLGIGTLLVVGIAAIPQSGALGAAWSVLAAELVVVAGYAVVLLASRRRE